MGTYTAMAERSEPGTNPTICFLAFIKIHGLTADEMMIGVTGSVGTDMSKICSAS